MKELNRLIIGLIVIFSIIGILIIYSLWPLITGKTVILSTAPVDPFNILMGQYININYNINTIPLIAEAKFGDTVYVKLKENENKTWEYDGASLTKPKKEVIKGKIISIFDKEMRVEYGIEQYFFERNAEFTLQNITVEVKISNSGRAKITQLLQNGKPVEIVYKKASLTS